MHRCKDPTEKLSGLKSSSIELSQSHTGSILLCPLFAGANALTHHSAIDGKLHRELLIVVRTGLSNQPVSNNLVLLLLHPLLQGSFVVHIV